MDVPLYHRKGLGMLWITCFSITLAFALPGSAFAHRPLFTNTRADDPDSAIRVFDPAVSHVIYAELTADEPQKWFVFENDQPREIPLQVGVPAAVSQGEIQPVIVFFGPGWPDPPTGLPFPPPPGEDVGVITIAMSEHRETFYEPVTGTESFILIDTQLQLSQPGRYYGVVYEANGGDGKVWVGIGKSEGFTWRDVLRLPGWIRSVRQFHEVAGWPRWAWMSALGLVAAAASVGAWVKRRR